jgi:hypothetical protein
VKTQSVPVVYDVQAVAIMGGPFENGSKVHGAHVDVLLHCRMVADEFHMSGERRPVVVNVKGTHEDPDMDLFAGKVFRNDIPEAGAYALLYCDRFLMRLDALHVDDCAVGRAYNVVSDGGSPRWVSEKQDVTPEQETRCGSQSGCCQTCAYCMDFHGSSCMTRTRAGPYDQYMIRPKSPHQPIVEKTESKIQIAGSLIMPEGFCLDENLL